MALTDLVHRVVDIVDSPQVSIALSISGIIVALYPMGRSRDEFSSSRGTLIKLGGLAVAAVATARVFGRLTLRTKPAASESTKSSTPKGLMGGGLPAKKTKTAPPAKSEANVSTGESDPTPLTGSAALLAKMRQKHSGSPSAEPAVEKPTPSPPVAVGTGAPLTGSAAILARMKQDQTKKINEEPKSTECSSPLWILTGGEAAKSIGGDLAKDCVAKGIPAKVIAMEDFKSAKFDKDPAVAVFLVETVENAQPAEAAGACVRFFNRKRKEKVQDMLTGKLRYTVMAIGDTNLLLDRQTTTAKDCNQSGQALDSALKFLGAERICTRCEANDAVGLEEAIEPWKAEHLWPALTKAMQGEKPVASSKDEMKELLILYGSQTGNSMEIAKQICAECPDQGIKAKVKAMQEVEMESVLLAGAVVLYVVSSTGDGDPPDNCAKFYSKAIRRSNPDDMFQGVQFSVLGLGDQNYTAFMEVPRVLHKRMEECGAKCFYPRGEADEVEGLDEYVEAWTENLWGPLKATLNAKTPESDAKKPLGENGASDAQPDLQPLKGVPALVKCRIKVSLEKGASPASPLPSSGDGGADGFYTASAPFMAPVEAGRLLTNKSSDRRVLHLEFNLKGSGIKYSPGDSLGVLPQNDPAVVDAIIARLGLEGSAVVSVSAAPDGGHEDVSMDVLLPHVRPNASVRDILMHCLDITQPAKKTLLRTLGEYTTHKVEQHSLLHLSSRAGKPAYDEQIKDGQPSLLDLLQKFPSCNPPFEVLLDSLPPLNPRYYSLTCAPEEFPNHAHVAFSVVNYKTEAGYTRKGVATNWLDRVAGPEVNLKSSKSHAQLPVFLKKGGPFHPPADVAAAHMIMVGPGTGVAPFRGFLQARRAAIRANPGAAIGEAWLFFGCRTPDEDFLYKEEFEEMAKEGTLTKLETAFSRVSDKKVYVQHRMVEHGAKLCELIKAGAYFYVCGDGGQMAKDVNHTLVSILEQHSGMKAKDVSSMIRTMITEQKYVRDIWS
mmetsp:Transcript_12453/g.23638  ORF Transcript_12453/g.23638 Transcript_12453/m.23638 type:complete len:1001 (-) Transcript_12453:321-3323(-)|eukprot:CAMPEP_0114307458 /NCGR_PEP_ID=MMETSP0059-20121206/17477_1 /TAXON_ID=36894 /ORGANISM="Pyramimonas parkeae, Strain CCMP726" /LENGTH=1000 /DNA_ID=CAMNT_0001430917 /DNA_START=33 /DNA_END=3035 /DNA_ORIENTATION=+